MAYYRCYFLEPHTRSPFGVPSLIEVVEDFSAETDEDARSKAEADYGRRRNHRHGFELWRGARLVRSQPPSAAANRPTSEHFWPIDRAGLAALIDVGLSNREIGAYFSVSPDDVYMLRDHYGLSEDRNTRQRRAAAPAA
jgi:hypothetical protein